MIETGERRRAVVIYRNPLMEPQAAGAQSILQHKSSILAVYQTMELIMPDILTFCAQFSDIIELEHYDSIMKWTKYHRNSAGRWRVPSAFFHDILISSGNPLLTSLHIALELYGEAPFLTTYQRSVQINAFKLEKQSITCILDALKSGKPQDIRESLSSYYRYTTRLMQETLNRLSAQYPDTVEQADKHFFWNAEGDRYPYYLQIIQNLAGKIGAGIYPLGAFLPSEAALAKEYQVSIHTIRRALAYLNRMHFVSTINGRGTQVIPSDIQASILGTSPASARLYLSATQLMALIIRPAALLVFDKLDVRIQEKLTHKIEQPYGIPLTHIADCVIENMPLHPLKVILQEANHPLRWSYYFSFDSHGKPGTAHINEISVKAFACLQKGDQQGFADLLFKCYHYILDSVSKLLFENGLVRDSWLTLPQ